MLQSSPWTRFTNQPACIMQMGELSLTHLQFKLDWPVHSPRVHEFIKEMRQKVLSRRWHGLFVFGVIYSVWILEYDIMTVGETPFTHDASALAAYVLPENKELDMIFHFELMDVDSPMEGSQLVPLIKKSWKLEELREIIVRWQLYKREQGFWNA